MLRKLRWSHFGGMMMKKALKIYFIFVLIDCIFLVLGHFLIQFCDKCWYLSYDTLIFSYIIIFFLVFFLNIYGIHKTNVITFKAKLLLLFLNPINYFGVISLGLILFIWDKFEWQGFGF